MKKIATATGAFLLVTFVALASAGLALADQPPILPDSFYGALTVNGEPAPAGVTIVAEIAGVERGRYTTDQVGAYGHAGPGEPKLIVEGTSDDIGKEIHFYIENYDGSLILASGDPTRIFESGADPRQVNLTFEGVQLVSVTTESATDVTTSSATLNMSYDFNVYGSGDVRFWWRQTGGTWENTPWVEKSGSGTFSCGLSGLSSSTDYEFYAQIRYGHTMNGSILTFRTATPGAPPVVPPVNEPPVAEFSWSPTYPLPDENVSFDASLSSDPDGSVVSWSWDFGDGTTGEGETTTHAYSEAGDYTVTLTVTDDDDATDSISKTLTVSVNRPPVADADGPYSVLESASVELDGTGSSDPDGDPLTYSWTITSDPTGGASLTNADTATPTFNAPAHVDNATEVTVELTVDDGHGHTDSDTATVTVIPVSMPEEVVSESLPVTIENIPAGGSATVTIENVPITGLEIRVVNAVENVRITVQQFTELPSGIEKSAPGIAYGYLNIVRENIVDADIESVTISFKVEKSWVSAGGIDEGTIALCRYDATADEWTPLDTTKVGENADYLYFSAESPSLSMFAVIGSKAEVPSEVPPFPWPEVLAIVAIVLIVLVVALYWLRFRPRRRHRL